MEPELAKKINESGIRKSTIELELDMPKNSLSGMINGTRPTPPKWETLISEYMNNQKMQVGSTSAIPNEPGFTLSNKEAETSPFVTGFDINMTVEESINWRLMVSYCEEKKITVPQLIQEHRKIMPKGLSTMQQIQWKIDHP